jgi:hypothetical protein
MKDDLEHLENEGWHALCAASGSEPRAPYEIRDLLQVSAGHDATALVYGGIAPRDEGPSIVATTTSTYVREDGQRRLPSFTPTPVPDPTTSA